MVFVCAGEGKGQSGKATYSFELIFYEPMESDVSQSTFILVL